MKYPKLEDLTDRTIFLIMAKLGVSDASVARELGIHRQQVNATRKSWCKDSKIKHKRPYRKVKEHLENVLKHYVQLSRKRHRKNNPLKFMPLDS